MRMLLFARRWGFVCLLVCGAIGCDATESKQAVGDAGGVAPVWADAGKLLGSWIAAPADTPTSEISARMQQGIADDCCRLDFQDQGRMAVAQGANAPTAGGTWQIVASDGNRVRVSVVAPQLAGSDQPMALDVQFHDDDHITIQQADDASLAFRCTRMRR
jgi:hypothetical protein